HQPARNTLKEAPGRVIYGQQCSLCKGWLVPHNINAAKKYKKKPPTGGEGDSANTSSSQRTRAATEMASRFGRHYQYGSCCKRCKSVS
ncbi:hypothetical protein, partial [Atlantibacter hermannii]|uniref:hypothetical protein n=1 Tax=Atlantibacter hermannii TaxID=565 RepID=UPI00307637CB